MKKELVYLNDKVVKKVFNSEKKECREYLKRIISLTTGIDIESLKDIELVTPEINSNQGFVESTVDSMYLTNDKYINIEINYNNSLVERGLKQGIERGIEQGIEKKTVEVIETMLDIKLEDELIIKLLQIDEKTLETIKSKIN